MQIEPGCQLKLIGEPWLPRRLVSARLPKAKMEAFKAKKGALFLFNIYNLFEKSADYYELSAMSYGLNWLSGTLPP